MIKLHVAPPSPRAFKVLAVARHLDVDFELCPVDLLNGAHLRPEFAALNPNKKMPVLEDDGFVLWERAWLNYAAPAGYPIDGFREIRRWYAGLTELPAWRESIVAPPF
jgi:glutathione S-transferase